MLQYKEHTQGQDTTDSQTRQYKNITLPGLKPMDFM